MANPQDPGTFEYMITDRIAFQNIPPKSGDTGTFEKWITDRIYFEDYVEQAAAPSTLLILTTGGGYSLPVG